MAAEVPGQGWPFAAGEHMSAGTCEGMGEKKKQAVSEHGLGRTWCAVNSAALTKKPIPAKLVLQHLRHCVFKTI